ncbi:palmitoyltransferase, putative (DHHC6) [Plasmodium malariae]|uniref:Palmitoyltransferase n=1 Tax=Plasmodium malariae TaxID=5858 RepID=A0A1A8VUB1_PLAMA|nr:palmitoyltransferase, putative (DHHC6) [Plasmodium malariae]
MANILPYVVISVKVAVLLTCIHLKEEHQQLFGNLYFYFFLYVLSFLLYAISSLCDPGYVTRCPSTYLKNITVNKFKKNIKENLKDSKPYVNHFNEYTTDGGDIQFFDDMSVSSSDCSSCYSCSSSTCSTNDPVQPNELDSLTIFHYPHEDTVLTEKGVNKTLKRGQRRNDSQKLKHAKSQLTYKNCMISSGQNGGQAGKSNSSRIVEFYEGGDKQQLTQRSISSSDGIHKKGVKTPNSCNNKTEKPYNIYKNVRSLKRLHNYVRTFGKLHHVSKWAKHTSPFQNIQLRRKKNVKYKYKLLSSLYEMHYTRCSSVNAYTSATEKLVDWEKAKLSTCYPTDLHIINKNNIIFSKDIKTRSRNTFRLSNNKFYQYNTPLSYCSACDVLQLLRSKHCKVCQRCVRTFDHHCPWINNCVAENNRCFFLLFLYIEEGTIFFSLKYISNVVYNMLYYDNWYFFCWLLMLLLTLSFFFFMILSLGIYHSYLCLVSKQIESKIRTAAMNQHYFGQMPFVDLHSPLLMKQHGKMGHPGKYPT